MSLTNLKMAQTKIYITSLAKTQPGKRPLTALAMPAVDTKPLILIEPTTQRKRQRLTHLNAEEKLMRRKLKNRVAAQTARDRKKAHMDGLEDRLEAVQKHAKRVQLENAAMKKLNAALVAENSELKKRLGFEENGSQTTQMTKVGTVTTVKKESKSPESAALDAPPQQGQVWALSTYLTVLMTLRIKLSRLQHGPDLYTFALQTCAGNVNNIKSDVLLGLLDGLEEQISQSQSETTAQPTDADCQSQIRNQINASLVGPTAEELESLKELIKFDHEYVKKPSKLADQTLNVITTFNTLVPESTYTVIEDTDDVLLTPEFESMDTPDFVPSLLDSTEDTFDCDITNFLFNPTTNSDAKSESGHSDISGVDSAFGDMPRSPFSDDATMSPGLGDGFWEESFTELFPTLEDMC